jgi:hypothetical protein
MKQLRLASLALAAGLTAALVAPLAAEAEAVAGGVVPKGTPYAAEVITRVTGQESVEVDYRQTVKNVCEAKSSKSSYDEHFTFTWDATYPQVTVPVATYQQLGAAYKRLHVQPTPTADGTGGLDHGSWGVYGATPPASSTGKKDCTPVGYSRFGHLSLDPNKPTVSMKLSSAPQLGDKGPPDVTVSIFNLSGDGTWKSDPEKWTDPGGGITDMAEEVGAVDSDIPQPEVRQAHDIGYLSWNALVLADAPQEYAPLVNEPSVTLHLADKGTFNCGGGAGNGVSQSSCKAQWSLEYEVKLTKRFLYYSKAAYPR